MPRAARFLSFALALPLVATSLAAQDETAVFRRPAGAAGELQLRDLAPLAGRIQVAERAAAAARKDEPLDPARTAELAQALAEAARAHLEPPLGEGQHVELVAGTWLLAIGTAEQQAWIDRFLRRQLEQRAPIRIDAAVFVLDPFAAAALDVPAEPRVVDAARGRTELARLEVGGAGVEKVSAATMMAPALQRCAASTTTQTSYVRDYEVTVQPGQLIANPVVGVVSSGVVLELFATSLDRGRLGLCGSLSLTDVVRPFAEKTVKLGPAGQPARVQVPAVRRCDVAVPVVIPEDGYAFVPGPSLDGRRTLLVVRGRVEKG